MKAKSSSQTANAGNENCSEMKSVGYAYGGSNPPLSIPVVINSEVTPHCLFVKLDFF